MSFHDTCITISMYNRLDLASQVVDSLLYAADSNKYKIVVSLDDPHNLPMRRLALSIPNKKVWRNKKNYGVERAIHKAIQRGFDLGYTKVIHIEDDVVLGHDALRYFQHMLDEYEHHHRIKAVCGFNRSDNLEGADEYLLKADFFPWGWATWKRTWDYYGDIWPKPFDVKLRGWVQQEDYRCVFPTVSRTKHIGSYGTHPWGINKKYWKRKFEGPWIGDLDRYLPDEYVLRGSNGHSEDQ